MDDLANIELNLQRLGGNPTERTAQQTIDPR